MRRILFLSFFLSTFALGQSGPLDAESYLPAPKEIQPYLDAPRHLNAIISNQKIKEMLGWSPEWSPPPEHAQNWLGEALRQSEKLGL